MEKRKKFKKIGNKPLFSRTLEEVILNFPKRSQEIIKMRFGVTADKPQTLESVGNYYQITRERVRQIIGEIIKKIKNGEGSGSLNLALQKMKFTLKRNNGIMSKREFLEKLSKNPKEQRAIEFFLECTGEIEFKKEKGKLENAVALTSFDFNHWKEIIEQAKLILKKEGKTFSGEVLFKRISERGVDISKEKLFHYLSVSEEIKKNSFGKWGMAHWSEINPKGTREKAFLVMKEIKKPLHYTEVAGFIDKYKLNKKKTHPQTVHNELIKDDRFVLVGRGRYALAEWGYKKGTVKDILGELLNESGAPVKCDDILNKVLSLRQVKKSTVMINLNNFFLKVGEDKYTVKK